MRVYEDEFHPLGGVAAEILRFDAEWLERALNGELADPGRDVRHYVHRDGRTDETTADPAWWLGTDPGETHRNRPRAASAVSAARGWAADTASIVALN